MQLCVPQGGPCAPLASTLFVLCTSRLVHLEPEGFLGQERWLPSLHLKTGYLDQSSVPSIHSGWLTTTYITLASSNPIHLTSTDIYTPCVHTSPQNT